MEFDLGIRYVITDDYYYTTSYPLITKQDEHYLLIARFYKSDALTYLADNVIHHNGELGRGDWLVQSPGRYISRLLPDGIMKRDSEIRSIFRDMQKCWVSSISAGEAAVSNMELQMDQPAMPSRSATGFTELIEAFPEIKLPENGPVPGI